MEAGTAVAEVCRLLGLSEPTCSRWKRKFAGMGIAELRRLRQLEQVSARRACQLMPGPRPTYRYRSVARGQTAWRMRLRD